ncbi:hypothetical protein Tco_1265077 [Tanacetum coccineum]
MPRRKVQVHLRKQKTDPPTGHRWIPTGKLFNSCTGKVDSEPTYVSIVDIPHIHACKQTLGLSAGLVLHQMTSDHNRSELGIHDHSNEPSSSKLVPKVVPLAVKTATSRQELELLFHHHIAMLRTTGINPMIQPELEDLPRIIQSILRNAVLRREELKEMFWIKGSKQEALHSQLRQEYETGSIHMLYNHKLIADI